MGARLVTGTRKNAPYRPIWRAQIGESPMWVRNLGRGGGGGLDGVGESGESGDQANLAAMAAAAPS